MSRLPFEPDGIISLRKVGRMLTCPSVAAIALEKAGIKIEGNLSPQDRAELAKEWITYCNNNHHKIFK